MRKVNIGVASTIPHKDDWYNDPREIEIPWVYGNNIGRPFRVKSNKYCDFGTSYRFDRGTLSRFLLNFKSNVITINSDAFSEYIGSGSMTENGIPSVTVPIDWFNYYMDLTGVKLRPNTDFRNNPSWNTIMGIVFSGGFDLKAIWTFYKTTSIDKDTVIPIGLSFVQEKHLPEIEYIEKTESQTNDNVPLVIECDWVYSIKNLPMTVVLGNTIIAGKCCFKDYKEQLLKLATELGYTDRYFDCSVQLTGTGHFSLTVILDDECNGGNISYLRAKILSISDDKIKISLLGNNSIPIPRQVREEFSKNNKMSSFVWKTTTECDDLGDFMNAEPIGFQIMSSCDRCSKISYSE